MSPSGEHWDQSFNTVCSLATASDLTWGGRSWDICSSHCTHFGKGFTPGELPFWSFTLCKESFRLAGVQAAAVYKCSCAMSWMLSPKDWELSTRNCSNSYGSCKMHVKCDFWDGVSSSHSLLMKQKPWLPPLSHVSTLQASMKPATVLCSVSPGCFLLINCLTLSLETHSESPVCLSTSPCLDRLRSCSDPWLRKQIRACQWKINLKSKARYRIEPGGCGEILWKEWSVESLW